MPQAVTTVSVAVTAPRRKRRHVVAAPFHFGGIDLDRGGQYLLQRLVGNGVGLAALERFARGGAEITSRLLRARRYLPPGLPRVWLISLMLAALRPLPARDRRRLLGLRA